ncbi:hypothetical protein SLEP1_g9780 [Rubroshorea leprosula]|uniref:Uncharacterized protein n=1 Tax=Rubroshorea leprosula TaxID=152421 RepID=A0AAV5IEG6_9ROSI|nr:hypothetical protein SLEP1_g9780 [Rubroshorea leprosula]
MKWHRSIKPNKAAIPEGSQAEGVSAMGLWILKAFWEQVQARGGGWERPFWLYLFSKVQEKGT